MGIREEDSVLERRQIFRIDLMAIRGKLNRFKIYTFLLRMDNPMFGTGVWMMFMHFRPISI